MVGMLPKCHKRLVPVNLDLCTKSVFLSYYALMLSSLALQLTREEIDFHFYALI
jgi:hypothetical protein